MRLAVVIALLPLPCFAEQPHAQEIQRALIQLDQRSAEFARPMAVAPLPADSVIAREWRPYQRIKTAEGAYELRFAPPVVRKADQPLPLPGGPRHGVEPIAPAGVGG